MSHRRDNVLGVTPLVRADLARNLATLHFAFPRFIFPSPTLATLPRPEQPVAVLGHDANGLNLLSPWRENTLTLLLGP
jgi:hypothetical protein